MWPSGGAHVAAGAGWQLRARRWRPHDRAKPAADFLLIGGGFFGYAEEIAATLDRRGRRVRWFEE